MPIELQCSDCQLTADEAARLWQETIAHQKYTDDEVTVRCVSEEEIHELNKRYRNKDKPTNVLTFSYPQQGVGTPRDVPRSSKSEVGSDANEQHVSSSIHDIALCITVAEREAGERGVPLRDYVALLLVHAFLHATGLDHEASDTGAEMTAKAERAILEAAGFTAIALS